MNPREALGKYANEQQRAVQEIRREAESIVREYLATTDQEQLLALVERERVAVLSGFLKCLEGNLKVTAITRNNCRSAPRSDGGEAPE